MLLNEETPEEQTETTTEELESADELVEQNAGLEEPTEQSIVPEEPVEQDVDPEEPVDQPENTTESKMPDEPVDQDTNTEELTPSETPADQPENTEDPVEDSNDLNPGMSKDEESELPTNPEDPNIDSNLQPEDEVVGDEGNDAGDENGVSNTDSLLEGIGATGELKASGTVALAPGRVMLSASPLNSVEPSAEDDPASDGSDDTAIDTEAELREALAVNGSKVTLGGDIELIDVIEILAGVEVTLDLGESTLTLTEGANIVVNGTLTVEGSGAISRADSATGSVVVYSAETFILNGGSVSNVTVSGGSAKIYGGAVANLTMAGGKLSVNGAAVTNLAINAAESANIIAIDSGSIANATFGEGLDFAKVQINDTTGNPVLYLPEGYALGNGGAIQTVAQTYEVATQEELEAAIGKAEDGDTIKLTDDIYYGKGDIPQIQKSITFDLGGKTLTTTGRNHGLSLANSECVIKDGKLVHAGTVAAVKVWNAKEISGLTIDVTGTSASGNTINGIVIQENAAGVGVIKGVKIYSTDGQGVAYGIETFNCGNATPSVIGSMENVVIEAKVAGMSISAPCGTATNCNIRGGVSGIEIWIKGTYSASLGLVNCTVEGGEQAVYAHDEFNSNPVTNIGCITLTADDATTFKAGADGDLLALTIARIDEGTQLILPESLPKDFDAKVGDTYYTTLAKAVAAANAVEGGATVTLLQGVTLGEKLAITGNVTIEGEKTITRDDDYTGTLFEVSPGATLTLDGGLVVDGGNDWIFDKDGYESALADSSKHVDFAFVTSAEGAPVATADMFAVNGEVVVKQATVQNHMGNANCNVFGLNAASSLLTLGNGALVAHNATPFESTVAALSAGSTLTIEDGAKVSGNYAGRNGGVSRVNNGTVVMNGGEISDNYSVDTNGTVFMFYGADSKFEMNGGLICGNSGVNGPNNGRGSAVYLHSGSNVTMAGGSICHNTGTSFGGIDTNVTNSVLTICGDAYVGENVSVLGSANADVNMWVERDKEGNDIVNENAVINGGTFTQDVTKWCAPGLIALDPEDDGVYIIAEWDRQIWDVDDLKYFAQQVDKGMTFYGETVQLMASIDLYEMGEDGEPVSFNPIGDSGSDGCYFEGTFDGQNHTISNMYQSGWDFGYEWGAYGSIGLFAGLNNATVKNLTIENAECFVEGGDVAAIAGSATGNCTFENITIKDSKIATYNSGCAGIVGWAGEGNYTFKGVTVDENTVIAGLWGSFDSSLGGIMGQLDENATAYFEDVSVACRIDAYNDVTASDKWYSYRMCGMLIGRVLHTQTINGANYPDPAAAGVTIGDNVKVKFGNWANYTYIWDNSLNYGCQRVESGYAYKDTAEERIDIAQYPGADISYIPFKALFGGPQSQKEGYYGLNEYEGVEVTFPAEAAIGETTYWSLDDALAAAQDGDTVTLLKDASVWDEIDVLGKKVFLDLGGNSVAGGRVDPVICVMGDADLTVMNGTIVNDYCIFVLGVADGSSAGNLTIQSGTYKGQLGVALVNKGALIIDGGEFSIPEGTYDSTHLLDCKDENYVADDAAIVVRGGTFHGFNPADNGTEGSGTNFVAEGYESVYNGDVSWTVKSASDVVAKNLSDGKTYHTVAAALKEAKDGDTVQLLKDATGEGLLQINSGVVVDLAGHTLEAQFVVAFGGMVVDGDGSTSAGMLKVSKDSVAISGNRAGQLPVWNGDGYLFTSVSFDLQRVAPSGDSGNAARYELQPRFSDRVEELFADGSADEEVAFKASISWRNATSGNVVTQEFLYLDEYVKNVYSSEIKTSDTASYHSVSLYLNVTGIAGLEELAFGTVIHSLAANVPVQSQSLDMPL